jgi:hypothetical protein
MGKVGFWRDSCRARRGELRGDLIWVLGEILGQIAPLAWSWGEADGRSREVNLGFGTWGGLEFRRASQTMRGWRRRGRLLLLLALLGWVRGRGLVNVVTVVRMGRAVGRQRCGLNSAWRGRIHLEGPGLGTTERQVGGVQDVGNKRSAWAGMRRLISGAKSVCWLATTVAGDIGCSQTSPTSR